MAKKKEDLVKAKESAKREKLVFEDNLFGFDEEDLEGEEMEVDNLEESVDYTIYDTGNVYCDNCEKQIVGRRHHSIEKEDFDLCDACFEQQDDSAYILVFQTAAPAEHDEEEEGKEEAEPQLKRTKA
jgi:hypothetical protein